MESDMGKERKYGPNGIEWNEDRKCKVKVKEKGNHNINTEHINTLKYVPKSYNLAPCNSPKNAKNGSV